MGVRRSRMHPNVCTMCETNFERAYKKKSTVVDATILFADLRGYTELSESAPAEVVHQILDRFYDECAAAIWDFDGLINKTVGDGVMAIFNFPIKNERHQDSAVSAAVELQRRCANNRAAKKGTSGIDLDTLHVGIGLHCGEVAIGDFGSVHRDFTAIGPTVNLAARLQEHARSGEILFSEEMSREIDMRDVSSPRRTLNLKGIDHPVHAFALAV